MNAFATVLCGILAAFPAAERHRGGESFGKPTIRILLPSSAEPPISCVCTSFQNRSAPSTQQPCDAGGGFCVTIWGMAGNPPPQGTNGECSEASPDCDDIACEFAALALVVQYDGGANCKCCPDPGTPKLHVNGGVGVVVKDGLNPPFNIPASPLVCDTVTIDTLEVTCHAAPNVPLWVSIVTRICYACDY